jgi:hypothetical protein
MKINVENFKSLVRKATLDLSIDSVQLNFEKDTVTSKMITQHSDGIVLLELENDAIIGMTENDDFQFNFSEPNQYVMPFLNLIDEEEANIAIHQDKITLSIGRQRSNMFFCSPTVVNVFSAGSPLESVVYFIDMPISEDFINAFKKIKKVGTRFGRVYFNVEGGLLSIESTDKRSSVSNTLKFDLVETDFRDMSICFDFGNFSKMMSLVSDDYEEFEIKISYREENELGMIFVRKLDDSENYFLMSKVD